MTMLWNFQISLVYSIYKRENCERTRINLLCIANYQLNYKLAHQLSANHNEIIFSVI